MRPLSARIVLRWSLALVFVCFGYLQIAHPAQWIDFLPWWFGYFPIPPEMLVQLGGWFVMCVASLVFFGVATRLSSLVLVLYLIGVGF